MFLAEYNSVFYKGIYIDGILVQKMTQAEVIEQLNRQNQAKIDQLKIELLTSDTSVVAPTTLTAQDIDLQFETQQTVEAAFAIGHASSWFNNLSAVVQLINRPKYFYSSPTFDRPKLQALIEKQVATNSAAILPSAKLIPAGSKSMLKIDPGKNGVLLSQDLIATQLQQTLQTWRQTPELPPTISYSLPIQSVVVALDEQQIEKYRAALTPFMGKHVLFLNPEKILQTAVSSAEMIDISTYIDNSLAINPAKAELILNKLAEKVNRPSQEPEFAFNPQNQKAELFKPALAGISLDKSATLVELERLLRQPLEFQLDQTKLIDPQQPRFNGIDQSKSYIISLPTQLTPPRRELRETNQLGINQVIGFGESYYAHSIPNRISNVALTASRINLTVVAPGAEFSFNKMLGEVSRRTGYKAAYIIQAGQTVLGDGGGVCQVSTTLFRALLDAGLPITKRKPHSYRVSYYELNAQPGFDATVFSGETDLRFLNDTGHHLLIVMETDSQNLHMTVTLYGTSDGRTSAITDYKQWGFRPAAATQYIVDPSLPSGRRVQIDWSATGISTQFTYSVYDKDKKLVNQQEFVSKYQPWSAKYLVGP